MQSEFDRITAKLRASPPYDWEDDVEWLLLQARALAQSETHSLERIARLEAALLAERERRNKVEGAARVIMGNAEMIAPSQFLITHAALDELRRVLEGRS